MSTIKEAFAKRIERFILTHNNIDVKFSEDKEKIHSLESRLERANISNDILIKDLKTRIIGKLDKSGIYYFKVKDNNYKLLARYNKNKNELYIFTILNYEMEAKDFDYNIIVEWFKEFFNISLDEKVVRVINDEELDDDVIVDGNDIYWARNEIIIVEV